MRQPFHVVGEAPVAILMIMYNIISLSIYIIYIYIFIWYQNISNVILNVIISWVQEGCALWSPPMTVSGSFEAKHQLLIVTSGRSNIGRARVARGVGIDCIRSYWNIIPDFLNYGFKLVDLIVLVVDWLSHWLVDASTCRSIALIPWLKNAW
jgi:hypothetical protein